ncbi:MAG: hypothetical protein IPJ74_06340 [Saprospiraceae bacterium]|nr:hypothetical protein [Saprospiraceae bacterium]
MRSKRHAGEPMRDVGHRGGEFMFRLKKYADTVFEEKVIVQPEGTERGGVDVVKPEEPIKEIPHKPTLQPMASLSELKKTLKKALANDLGEAFELFYNTIDDNSSVTNLLINLQGQYNGMKKQENMGLSEPDFANRTYNRIRVALQDTVDKLEEDDLKPDALKASGTPVVVNNGNDQQVKVTISELERKGLESQLNILLKKLNFFLQQQAVINDPSQRFTLDMQIEETQQKVDEIKAKLGI